MALNAGCWLRLRLLLLPEFVTAGLGVHFHAATILFNSPIEATLQPVKLVEVVRRISTSSACSAQTDTRANGRSGENPNESSSSAVAAAAAAAAGRAHESAPATSLGRCVSVPGAYAVDGPGHLSNSRNRNNDDDDNDSGSVSSAVQEVQAYLARPGGATRLSNVSSSSRNDHRRPSVNNVSYADLATHPEIEYLAEATLVEAEPADATSSRSNDAPGGDDDVLGNSRSSSRIDEEGAQGENEDGPVSPFGGTREDDISTLGPPPEILAEQQQDAAARAQRPASNDGTHATAADTVHGSTVVTAKKLDHVCGFMSRRAFFVSLSVLVLLLLVVGLSVGLTTRGSDGEGSSAVLFPDPDEVLATVPEPICFSLLPKMSQVSKACPDPTSLPRGGPLCQLVAEGLLEAVDPAANIDIAIINGGAMRTDMFPGDLTVGTVRTQILPFSEDRAAYLSVTPAEIKASLETPLIDDGLIFTEAMQKEFFPDVPTVKLNWSFEAKYPYAAGLRYDVDIAAPDGEKVSNILINPRYAGDDDWIALDVTDTSTLIRVVTSDYLAGGGDGYFTDVPRERIEIQEDLALADLFLTYCSRQEELIGPDRIEDMSTREFLYDEDEMVDAPQP